MAFARIRSLLRPAARRAEPPPPVRDPFRPETLRPGTRIGGYVVGSKRVLGRSGVVYEAKSPDGHPFALKVARHRSGVPGSRGSLMEARFQRGNFCHEYLRHHPHVVQLQAFDRHPDPLRGWLYQVLEWVPGSESITCWARRTRRSLREVVTVFKQLATACGDMHEIGIRHRDLTPEAIVVTPAGVAKLLDFSSATCPHAKQLTPPAASAQPCTHAYLPPELCVAILQQQRSERPVPFVYKPSADLHTLGVVFYEVLTGRHPFNLELEGEELLMEIVETPPARPRSFTLDVPRELDEIVMTLLRKNPMKRYQRSYTLGVELEMLLNLLPPA